MFSLVLLVLLHQDRRLRLRQGSKGARQWHGCGVRMWGDMSLIMSVPRAQTTIDHARSAGYRAGAAIRWAVAWCRAWKRVACHSQPALCEGICRVRGEGVEYGRA